MQDAVEYGGEHHAHDDQEDHAAVQRVEAGEDLGRVVWQRIDRPHSAKDHRRIEESVDGAQVSESDVPGDPYQQRATQQHDREHAVPEQANRELTARDERLVGSPHTRSR